MGPDGVNNTLAALACENEFILGAGDVRLATDQCVAAHVRFE
jgi:hypothetical protein